MVENDGALDAIAGGAPPNATLIPAPANQSWVLTVCGTPNMFPDAFKSVYCPVILPVTGPSGNRFDVEHYHPPIGDPSDKPYGNGVLLWFEIDDFEAAVVRAMEMKVDIVFPRHRNPPTGEGPPDHWECWLRDPDGYIVVLASPDGTARIAPA